MTAVWDMDRAKLAGLWPGHPDGNWRKSPKAMLVARATAEASRWVASDALLGLPLMAEEVEDGDELAPLAIEAAAPADADANGAGAAPPAAKAKTTAKRKTAPARAALPAGPPPPPAEPPPPAAPPGPRPSKPQLAKLHAGLTAIGITGREEGLGLISAWAGRQVASTGDLRPAELDVVLERLDALRAVAAKPPDQAHPPDDPEPPPPDEDLEANPP